MRHVVEVVVLVLFLGSSCCSAVPLVVPNHHLGASSENVNLYVSFHGGKVKTASSDVNMVYRYFHQRSLSGYYKISRSYPLSSGGSKGKSVLGSGTTLQELRGLAFLADGTLLVNNAYKKDSEVDFSLLCL